MIASKLGMISGRVAASNLAHMQANVLKNHQCVLLRLQRLDQWLSNFHELWPPSKFNWTILNIYIVTLGLCNTMAKLPSKGLYSWPPKNCSVIPKEGWGPHLRNPGLDILSNDKNKHLVVWLPYLFEYNTHSYITRTLKFWMKCKKVNLNLTFP